MRSGRAVLAVVATLALTAGCGVSETRRPVDVGDAAVAGSISGGAPIPLPGPDEAVSATDLVTSYLQAAVGDYTSDEDYDAVVKRVREFFVPKSADKWDPGSELKVMRVGKTSSSLLNDGRSRVTVRLQLIGVMTERGEVTPRSGPNALQSFIVLRQGSTQWRLESAPPGLMISDATLKAFYEPSPVYFWNKEKTRLVPDLRYVPRTTALGEQLNQVVDWMLAGPSEFLPPMSSYVRTGTSRKGEVVPRADRTVVNLSSAAAGAKPEDLQRLADQLRWTLFALVEDWPVELQIEGQSQVMSSDDYRSKNATAANPSTAPLFSIAGRAARVVPKNDSTRLAVLKGAWNQKVWYAALSRDHNLAAFVDDKQQSLRVVQVTETPNQRPPRTIRDLPTPIGRPVWIPDSPDRFLVPADGRLFTVDAAGHSAEIDTGLADIRAVSVPPDGRRVALVAGGKAYVAGLSVQGNVDNVAVDPDRRQLVPGRMSVAAVAWASETEVLVAGAASGGAALFRVTVDGAIVTDQSPDEAALTDVIAFPDPPGPGNAGEVIARTANAVFYVFNTRIDPAPDLVRPFYAG